MFVKLRSVVYDDSESAPQNFFELCRKFHPGQLITFQQEKKMGVTECVFEIRAIRGKMKGFLQGYPVVMVTYCVAIMTACSSLIVGISYGTTITPTLLYNTVL